MHPGTPVRPDEQQLQTMSSSKQALRHGGEHVIKLADTALKAYETSHDELALAAVLTAIDLDA